VQRRIQPLSQQLANQIAAGEVVERPASVVKELLENSIDAGATRIDLELEQGGGKRILVLDDGAGIHCDDLPLAVRPHATSKIYNQQELEQVASLGFRGEALASIASVCRFTLSSRQQGEEGGWQVSNDGKGELSAAVPCALPPGTRIEVRDLFFNTPARRKFLRSERTEFLHVEEVLRRIALSRFDIAFSLQHNARQVLRLGAARDEAQRTRRVADVLGKGFVQHAMTLAFEAAGMRLWGWLATADYSRSQADSQYFYLNGRIIRDKLISHAVRQAYQGVLEAGRHPAYLLYLELDPQQVDVNVHPTKHEVRFRQSRLVHDFVFRALRNALAGQESAYEMESIPAEEVGSAERMGRIPAKGGVLPARDAGATRPRPPGTARVAEQMAFYRQARSAPARERYPETPAEGPLGRALAVLYGCYLLAQNSDGPLLLDLDAARRHLLTRRLQAMLADGEVQSQPLLIPVTFELDEAALDSVEEARGELLRLGFVVERLGAGSLVAREVPLIARGADVERILHALLELLAGAGEPLSAESPELIRVLVGKIVESSRLERPAEAGRLLRELEALEDGGRRFCRPLSQTQLQQWLGSSG
jgi:DNA mismatch repair protein MutL